MNHKEFIAAAAIAGLTGCSDAGTNLDSPGTDTDAQKLQVFAMGLNNQDNRFNIAIKGTKADIQYVITGLDKNSPALNVNVSNDATHQETSITGDFDHSLAPVSLIDPISGATKEAFYKIEAFDPATGVPLLSPNPDYYWKDQDVPTFGTNPIKKPGQN